MKEMFTLQRLLLEVVIYTLIKFTEPKFTNQNSLKKNENKIHILACSSGMNLKLSLANPLHKRHSLMM